MDVHLGTGCFIRSSEIIGIFSVKDTSFYGQLRRRDGRNCEIRDLTDHGGVCSCVLTDQVLYLSAISAVTLQKRVRDHTLLSIGGNNDR